MDDNQLLNEMGITIPSCEVHRQGIVTKTSFLRGVRCLKLLYLHKYYPERRDEAGPRTRGILLRGNNVGILARQLFPGGTDLSPDDPGDMASAVSKTVDAVSRGAEVLYEAAFHHEGAFCVIDILVRDGESWRAFEVKSATGVSPSHLLDASFQYHVMKGAGIDLKDISLVHINSRYLRNGDLSIQSLFTISSVKKKVLEQQDMVQRILTVQREVLNNEAMPDMLPGEQCFSPAKCDFFSHCWGDIPEGSVLELVHMPKNRIIELYRNGVTDIADIPEEEGLNAMQRLQVSCAKSGKAFVQRDKLESFLRTCTYPLYFLDFESACPAVPLFEGTRPYQHVPFQYSLHYCFRRGGEAEHREFLAEGGRDHRREFVSALLRDTAGEGLIVVYDSSYEAGRLRELGRVFPEFCGAIEERIHRMRDLMIPFRNRYYYAPAMKGRCSIKSVLPALVPGSGYDNLRIGNGYEAVNVYEQLQKETDVKTRRNMIQDLKEYCRMDTRAMVEILRFLENIIENPE